MDLGKWWFRKDLALRNSTHFENNTKNKMEVYFQPGSGLQTIDVLHGNNSIPPGPHFEITARQFQFFSHFEDCIPRANFDTFLWALAGKPKWTTGKRWMVKHEDLQPPIIFWEGFWRADPFISILTLYWTGKTAVDLWFSGWFTGILQPVYIWSS